MKEYRRITCQIMCGDVVYSEEFNQLTKDGWQIEKTLYDETNYCVHFMLCKEK